MSHFSSPFDFNQGSPEAGLGVPFMLSAAFHILAAWLVLFVLPNLLIQKVVTYKEISLEVIPIKFVGAQGQPLPPAGSELNKSDADAPASRQDTPTRPQPMPAVPEQNHVVPLGDIADKIADGYRDLTKTPAPTPQIVPPEVFDLDAQIGERIAMVGVRVKDRPQDPVADKADNLGTVLGAGDDVLNPSIDGIDIDPEKSAYYAQVKDKIERNWLGPGDVSGQGLREAVVWITIEPDGYVSRIEIKQSTGNGRYDRSLEMAVTRSNPLPALPPVFGEGAVVTGLKLDPNQIQRMR